MTIGTRLGRVLAATLIGAAAGVVATQGSASAAGACTKGTGVTVVVGSAVACDANGGGPAASNFTGTGHSLTYVNNSSFVCKVDGAPSSAVCARTPPADAYWGLFWSNGTSGSWTYASSGVASLKVPTGGWVAFVFQNSTSKTYPSVTPLAAAPAKPTPTGTTKGGGGSGGGSGGKAGHATGATPTPTSTTKGGDSTKSPTGKKSATSATPTDGATTQPGDDLQKASQETGGSGSLGWIAAVLAVVLLAGMGAVVWRRRTAGGRTP
ncbi:MAG: hypothetical protein QOJ72_1156 [Nocardioidaceae bacterium]|jgi:hypothetical protein|nr:hypothetical protein [Nocardioidaceae bacterium]